MGSSCFFLDPTIKDKRPTAPFPRTTISLRGANRPFALYRDATPVPPAEVKNYLFFDHNAEQIGSYPLAFHHSIPFNLLKSSWDPIVLFCKPEAISALWAHYLKDHPTAKESSNEIKSLTDKLLAIRKKHGLDLNYGGTGGTPRTFESYATAAYAAVNADASLTAITSDESNALLVILCWGAWNLTEGPEGAIRIEDPGEAFDEFGDCAPSESLKVRYRAVARLNSTLLKISTEYQANKAAPVTAKLGAGWSDELMEALRVCAAMDSTQRELVYVDPLMWGAITSMTIAIQSKNYYRQYKLGRHKVQR